MADLELSGCTPEPLMGYLKALGVFRLVAEDEKNGDPSARLSWKNGVAHLDTTLDRDALAAFFLNDYRPTPIVAPWNSGSGFYKGTPEHLDKIASAHAERLSQYRKTIERIRIFVPKGSKDAPKDEHKVALLTRCRAELPDVVVPWLDVCFVLGEEQPGYFPLLGTGANDGRLDFTNNFMQRVADIIAVSNGQATADSAGWFSAAIFADLNSLTELQATAIGQFNPGGIGGPNGVQGNFEAASRVNPWDFVLMIEGALLFAGAVTRRLGANQSGRAVFPFSVESVAVGYGSATSSEETREGSRAELWLPLWNVPTALAEIRQLFAEGRAQLGRRQARNAVEFALAVNLLGVGRGLTAFSRFGFLKRNGLAFLAAPLGRVPVTPRPDARLLEDPRLTDWIDQFRRACRDKDKTPARYQTALRQIDRAMFDFAGGSETGEAADRKALVSVLAAVGRAERTLAGGLAFCKDKYIRPLAQLSPRWLEQADDGSPEFRLAAALTGIAGDRQAAVGPFRVFLEPVETRGAGFNWDASGTSAVWSNRSLAANLAAVFRRFQMEAFRAGLNRLPLGFPKPLRPAPLADVLAFLRGDTDDDKLTALLWALPAVDWSKVERLRPEGVPPLKQRIPIEFGIPRLLVEPLPLVARGEKWVFGETAEPTTPDPDVFHALAGGRGDAVGSCVDRAARRLKSGGRLVHGYRNRRQAGKSLAVVSPVAADRLLAAMLFPLSRHDLRRVANAVLYPPETEE